ncbi:MAG: hypothetical protein KGR26_14210, partial [Cyanobacteria bacterium REEB65]|nr:hypothetical protein [Cyanobacteria bacterium REEB65]
MPFRLHVHHHHTLDPKLEQLLMSAVRDRINNAVKVIGDQKAEIDALKAELATAKTDNADLAKKVAELNELLDQE